uniref:Alternative protein NBPF11 n=1 Tax=Homo sapiens TaxID=9606 RepID=L8ECP6_HUMAN|nr:alternative protein NBPF11 [Homo sapiens]
MPRSSCQLGSNVSLWIKECLDTVDKGFSTGCLRIHASKNKVAKKKPESQNIRARGTFGDGYLARWPQSTSLLSESEQCFQL